MIAKKVQDGIAIFFTKEEVNVMLKIAKYDCTIPGALEEGGEDYLEIQSFLQQLNTVYHNAHKP